MTERAPRSGRGRRAVGWVALALLTAVTAAAVYALLVLRGH